MKSPVQHLVVAASLLLAGTALQAAPKVGVLLKGRSGFWMSVEKGALSAGAICGAEVVVKEPVNETDVAVQLRMLAALDAQGVQAIVIAPANSETLAGPVADLARKGVKIVVIDSPLPGGVGVFVGTDQVAAGKAAGALLASLVHDGDAVAILKHSQSSAAATQREAGAVAALRLAHPHLVVHGDIYASSETGLETERSELLLARHPDTRAILASGTPGTMAMLKVLEAHPQASPVHFVGFGFNMNAEVADALRKGIMDGWIAQLPEMVGYRGVQAAVDLLAGKPVPRIVSTDFVVVTKASLGERRVQGLFAGN